MQDNVPDNIELHVRDKLVDDVTVDDVNNLHVKKIALND
jgi:hypothetical protein